MKLLVVEDNDRVAQFVAKGLREEGHIVDLASTGRVFLASLENTTGSSLRPNGVCVKLGGFRKEAVRPLQSARIWQADMVLTNRRQGQNLRA
jgi:DNA-binding response OmpR family regulator